MALRDGPHVGASQYAWVNRTPLLATRSKAGVLTTGSPVAPVCAQDWSSEMQNSTFGRSCVAPRCPASGSAALAPSAEADSPRKERRER